MKYLVVPNGKILHKISTKTSLKEKTVCGLSIHKVDRIYTDSKPTLKVVMDCPVCFATAKKAARRLAYLESYYSQAAYWGWTKKPKSTVATIITKPKTGFPETIPLLEIPAVDLLTMEEEEKDKDTQNIERALNTTINIIRETICQKI